MSYAEATLRILRDMMAADPKATNYLMLERVAANAALINHPTIQIRNDDTVGFIGILNGIIASEDPATRIAVVTAEESGEIVDFRILRDQPIGEVARPAISDRQMFAAADRLRGRLAAWIAVNGLIEAVTSGTNWVWVHLNREPITVVEKALFTEEEGDVPIRWVLPDGNIYRPNPGAGSSEQIRELALRLRTMIDPHPSPRGFVSSIACGDGIIHCFLNREPLTATEIEGMISSIDGIPITYRVSGPMGLC